MSTFAILEKFQYKFNSDDLNKKWELFGYPKKTYDLIKVKNNEPKKEKIIFYDHMTTEQ